MRRSLELALTPALSRKRERGNGVIVRKQERGNGVIVRKRERGKSAHAKCFSPLPLAGEGRVRASVVQRRGASA
jgi:hypothetical protein